MSVLRNRLQPGAGRNGSLIVTEYGAYRLDTDRAKVDLDRFDTLVRQAKTAPASQARGLLLEASRVAAGQLFEDEPYADWVLDARDRYARQRVGATRVMALAKPQDRELITVDNYTWNPLDLPPHLHRRCTADNLADAVRDHHVRIVCEDKDTFYKGYTGPAPTSGKHASVEIEEIG